VSTLQDGSRRLRSRSPRLDEDDEREGRQLMPSIVETLEQEKMWYGQDGRPYLIEEMELSHVVNTLAFLRRRAPDLQRHRAWWDALNQHATQWQGLEDDPAVWLERRPLIKALKYELLLRGTVDGEVVDVRGELASPPVEVGTGTDLEPR